MRLGETERDYYLLGSAGVTTPRDADDTEAQPAPAWTPAAKAQHDESDQSAAADWTPGARRHRNGGEPDGAADDGSEAGQ